MVVVVALRPSLRFVRPRRGAAQRQGRSEATDAGEKLSFKFFILDEVSAVLDQAG